MGLSALDAALSGLRVSQQQINVISNNVANASTPGYTRKILPQSSQALLGVTYQAG
jgi:flagellar hook-associated protein 1 FlgK